MCGRYVLIDGRIFFAVSAQLQTWRDEGKEFDLLPAYDARPTNLMPVVAELDNSIQVRRMRWGLVPHWSKDGKTEFSTFNARAETVHSSRMFSPYFKSARCLVPADGFFEWKKYREEPEVRGSIKPVEKKQKMFIAMKDRKPFMMAGLFSVWKKPDNEEFPTYTIITTASNTLISEIHNRMPVIVEPKNYDVWLNRGMKDVEYLKTLLVSYPSEKMIAFPVKNKSEDSPEALERIDFTIPAGSALISLTNKVVGKKSKK